MVFEFHTKNICIRDFLSFQSYPRLEFLSQTYKINVFSIFILFSSNIHKYRCLLIFKANFLKNTYLSVKIIHIRITIACLSMVNELNQGYKYCVCYYKFYFSSITLSKHYHLLYFFHVLFTYFHWLLIIFY